MKLILFYLVISFLVLLLGLEFPQVAKRTGMPVAMALALLNASVIVTICLCRKK